MFSDRRPIYRVEVGYELAADSAREACEAVIEILQDTQASVSLGVDVWHEDGEHQVFVFNGVEGITEPELPS